MNVLYGLAKEQFLNGSLSWVNDPIKVLLVGTLHYSPAMNADQFLSDIPVAARVATSGTLTGKTATLGVLDARDITVEAVPSAEVDALVLFKDTGTAASSRLIVFIDSGVGLPVNAGGGNVAIAWSNDSTRIVTI